MARSLDDQVKWKDFLDKHFETFEKSLNLTNQVVEHLRCERVVSQFEYEELIPIPEESQTRRFLMFNGILRTDVANVKFEHLVKILQIEDYRCSTAAKLFLDFAKSIGHDTSDWVPQFLDIPDNLSLFAVPRNMTYNKVPIISSFENAKAIPKQHLQRPMVIECIRLKLNDTECNGDAKMSKIVIITGIGGIGKSTVAAMFLHDVINEVDNAIWIDATSVETITTSMAIHGNTLGINTVLSENQFLPFELYKTQLYNKLCQGRTLIILDNADKLSDQDLEQFLPSIMPERQYRPLILVTSRPSNWGKFEANVLPLGLIEDRAAVDYVMKNIGQFCLDEKEAEALVRFYGNLIIGIHSAIVLVLQSNKELQHLNGSNVFSVSDLLNQVKLHQLKIEENKVPGIWAKIIRLFTRKTPVTDLKIELGEEYEPLERLWAVTFEKLEKFELGKFALQILDICCCVDPNNIPVYLLECIFSGKKPKVAQAIQLLIDYALLTSCEKSMSGNPVQCLKIHRVLQKVCWKKMGSVRCLVDKYQLCVASLPCAQAGNQNPLVDQAYDSLMLALFSYFVEIESFNLEQIDERIYGKVMTSHFRCKKNNPVDAITEAFQTLTVDKETTTEMFTELIHSMPPQLLPESLSTEEKDELVKQYADSIHHRVDEFVGILKLLLSSSELWDLLQSSEDCANLLSSQTFVDSSISVSLNSVNWRNPDDCYNSMIGALGNVMSCEELAKVATSPALIRFIKNLMESEPQAAGTSEIPFVSLNSTPKTVMNDPTKLCTDELELE